jgi:hypothetical protein
MMSDIQGVNANIILHGFLIHLSQAVSAERDARLNARRAHEESAALRRSAEAFAAAHAAELTRPVKNEFGAAGVRHIEARLRIVDDAQLVPWAKAHGVGAETVVVDREALDAAVEADPEVKALLLKRELAATVYHLDRERLQQLFEADRTVPPGAEIEPERVEGYVRLSRRGP